MNKKESIDLVERANADWCLHIESLFISEGPDKGAYITSDDLWAISIAKRTYPREPRAMGAVMRFLQKWGYIKPLQKWQPSTRPACHSRPVRVWRVV